ncbi:hypothetical protein Y032_0448g1639 [Ancylostoma ceylanicum]|uniref:Uncharacterized protein n=1 Tax=Ancylostoma ceylanicum TaxID=53326 RepID=A0A016WZX3_9BILA|nr:hypothetical protein Y032_0448g1639 [Ancylostoma ceylanicum]
MNIFLLQIVACCRHREHDHHRRVIWQDCSDMAKMYEAVNSLGTASTDPSADMDMLSFATHFLCLFFIFAFTFTTVVHNYVYVVVHI